ncbi:uncharacterized protein LOC131681346 [Topomyia yanbarensis]|uniref:uncharacterized protein LOC131681346 n=1 Tax=Topomyia yanbarensis TaxID=2498891 RepID=UPI00273B0A0D|nr:uncharacterized protein LOC131681346 [Topomyia yanbarensis]
MIVETRVLEKAAQLAKQCRLPRVYHNVIGTWPDEQYYRYFAPVYEQRLGQLAFLLNEYQNVLLEQPDRYNAEFQMNLLLITYEHDLIAPYLNHPDLSIDVFMAKCEIESTMLREGPGPSNILLRKLSRYLLRTFGSLNWEFQYGNLMCLRETMHFFASHNLPGYPKKLIKHAMLCIKELVKTVNRYTFAFALSLLESSLTKYTFSSVSSKALRDVLDGLIDAPLNLRRQCVLGFISAVEKCIEGFGNKLLKSSELARCYRVIDMVLDDIPIAKNSDHTERLLMLLLRLLYIDYNEFPLDKYICKHRLLTNRKEDLMKVAWHGAPRFAEWTVKVVELLTTLPLKYDQCPYIVKLISLALLVATRLPRVANEEMMLEAVSTIVQCYEKFITGLAQHYSNWKPPETFEDVTGYLTEIDTLVFILGCMCNNQTALLNRYLRQLSLCDVTSSVQIIKSYQTKFDEFVQIVCDGQRHLKEFVQQHENGSTS